MADAMRNTFGFPAYFDGDTDRWGSAEYTWESEPHNSRSIATMRRTQGWIAYIDSYSGEGGAALPATVALASETVQFPRGRDLVAFSFPGGRSSGQITSARSVLLGLAGGSPNPVWSAEGLDTYAAHVEPDVIYSANIGFSLGKLSSLQIVSTRAVIFWRDSQGSFISRSDGEVTTRAWAGGDPLGAYSRNSFRDGESITAQSPAGAAFASLAVEVLGEEDGPLPPDLTVLADTAILVIGEKIPEYFDGATPNDANFTYSWEGVPDGSESLRVGEAPLDSGPGPIIDPSCPPPPEAPQPPRVKIGCGTSTDEWRRVWYIIPEEEVYEWGAVVPSFTLDSGADDVNAMRITIYENPDNVPPEDFDDDQPYVARWHVSYLPANSTMTIDGTTETITAAQPGGSPQDAGYLVTGPGQGPVLWSNLTCGGNYLVSVETPLGDDPENVSLSMSLTREFG